MSAVLPAWVPEWTEVLASALVGTERRPIHSRLSTVDDPAFGLLDAAAVRTAYRRAGVRPVTGVATPVPAGEETMPEIGAAARDRLTRLLGQGSAGGDRFDAELRAELLAEWLAEAGRAGRRVPSETLPALLDAGRRDRSLRPLIVAVGGVRARWLATRRAQWRYLAGERDESGAVDPGARNESGAADPGAREESGAADPGARGESGAADPGGWELGTAGQRVAYLAALRATDPDAARELLVAGWASEGPDERAALLGTWRTGLGPADEEFLDKALADRRKEVRGVAAELLGALPGSAYRSRMVTRATACVRRDGDVLLVEPPAECDPAMKRDGIVAKPPHGVGERAWWLEQILARTPVETWADPAAFLALPVPDGWQLVVLRGLAQAAVAARDPDWAAAVYDELFATGRHEWRSAGGELFDAVLATLPGDRLADRAGMLLLDDPAHGALNGLLTRCPRPWPPALVDRLFTALAGAPEDLGQAWRIGWLCRTAATRLPVDCADRFAELATTVRARSTELADRLGLDLLIEVLRFRHDLLEELH